MSEIGLMERDAMITIGEMFFYTNYKIVESSEKVRKLNDILKL